MNCKSHEEVLVGLELAVGEILNPENMNVWISARQRSITAILKEAGVNTNYSSAVIEELKKIGLIEREGVGAGMTYKVVSNIIPDSKGLAEKIYLNFRERFSKKKEFDGYPTSSSSDLKPMYKRKHKEMDKSGKAVVVPFEPAKIGSIGYIIDDNDIVEVRIISVHYDSVSGDKIQYDVEKSIETDYVPEGIVYINVENLNCHKFFNTPEDAAAFLVRNYVRYKKRAVIKESNKKS